MRFLLCLATLMVVPLSASGAELREFYKNARLVGMGNAYVALADDEAAIFMNPAGLAGQPQTKINYAVLDIEGSTDLATTYLSNASAFSSNVNGNTINAFMNRNIYARAQLTPTVVMNNVGLGIISDGQVAILAKNQAMPQVTLGYQFTNGIQLGWGTSVLKGKAKQKHDLRIGIGSKILWRRGGYKLLSLSQLMNIDANLLTVVGGDYERAYGFDAGMQYVRMFGPQFKATLGLSVMDIGDTKFSANSDPVPNNMSAGLGLSYELKQMRARFGWDYRHMMQTADIKKKLHTGFELSIPMVSVYGGFYQAALSYGTAFDFWLFRLTLASYAEEQGTLTGEDTERRYMIRLALKVGL